MEKSPPPHHPHPPPPTPTAPTHPPTFQLRWSGGYDKALPSWQRWNRRWARKDPTLHPTPLPLLSIRLSFFWYAIMTSRHGNCPSLTLCHMWIPHTKGHELKVSIFYLSMNKLLSTQSNSWWFQTQWRSCDVTVPRRRAWYETRISVVIWTVKRVWWLISWPSEFGTRASAAMLKTSQFT